MNLNHFNFYYLFYCFIIYAGVGWAIEVIYHVYKLKKFINRGFLTGPLCPVYGITAVTIIMLLTPIKNNFILLILGGFIVSSVIEFITGFLLEILFHTRWWDYSEEKFNISGYVCLKFSLYWSVTVVIFLKFIHPHISIFIHNIPSFIGQVVYNILIILLVIDITITVMHLIQFRKLIRELHKISTEIKGNFESIKFSALSKAKKNYIQNRNTYLKKKYDGLISNMNFKHRFFIKAYPSITSKKFSAVINEIKDRFNQ